MAIVTMPEALYRTSAARFNPVYLNIMSGPGGFNPQATLTGPGGVFWQPEFTFAPHTVDDYLLYRRFVMKLRGGRNLARLYDPTLTAEVMGSQPRGAGGLSSTVNVRTAAVAGAESLVLKNLVAGAATVFKAGDMIGIGENLYPIEDDAPSDGSGEATVALGIPLRLGVAVDDPVTTVKPTGLFRLATGGQDLGLDVNRVGVSFTLTFQEVPDVVA
jgi:hypothetical protein